MALLDIRQRTGYLFAAVVIGHIIVISAQVNTRRGVPLLEAVVAPAGVVGRVIMPGAFASKVQLLIDRNAAAGVLDERSRAQGVVVGTGTGRLKMDYVPSSADVKVGDRIVTSGIDGIYPKG